MKDKKINQSVEFNFDCVTYKLEADYDNNNCHWWNIDRPQYKYDCPLEDPGYFIAPYEESPLDATFFFHILGADDHQKMACFLTQFNEAIRKILPRDHKKYREVSPRLADYL